MTQKDLYLRLYDLYETILDKNQGELGEGLSPLEFKILFNEVQEFNDLLKKFRPNLLKFNKRREEEILQKISLWYEDAPAFMSAMLRIKYEPIYKKSKRVLYDIAKSFVSPRGTSSDDTRTISRALDKIFNGLTSNDEADGYSTIGYQYLEKFSRGDITIPALKKLWSRYVLDSLQESLLFEGRRRGFFNPFEEDEVQKENTVKVDFNVLLNKERNKANFLKIEPFNEHQRKNNIRYEDGRVIAKGRFFKGDIIEEDPVKEVPKEDLALRQIRDIAFEVVPNQMWGIPIGYSGLYRRSDEVNKEPNVDYEYDALRKIIVLRAMNDIIKGEEMILNTKYHDLNNLYKKE